MNFSIKVFLRKDFTKADGTNPLYLRITIDRKKSDYSLNVSVPEKFWDIEKQTIKKTHPKSEIFNKLILNEANRAENILVNAKLHNQEFSLSEFEKYFKHNKNSDDFYFFAEKEIELMNGLVKESVRRQYKYEISKLLKFKKTLKWSDINYNFIIEYENYMLNTLKNKQNTTIKTFKKIKRLINIALKKEIITTDPFKNYAFKKEKTSRNFLSIEELKSLEKLLESQISTKLKNVLRYFLFSCYTGLRYQDICTLKYDNIVNNTIVLTQEKTSEQNNIPLTEQALKLLGNEKSGIIFKTYSNQSTNDYLKVIAERANIERELSFHCARHTFATICLQLNIPIEVVSKLLGHSDIKTTQIYAKIIDQQKISEMQKWNNF